MSSRTPLSMCLLALLASLSPDLAAQDAPAWQPARFAGLVTDPLLSEISGMAVSARHPDALWVHNDSGDAPVIHAMSRRGQRLATITLDGVEHSDWEDLAGFELGGQRYLLIADTGDNGGIRTHLSLHVIAEPEALQDQRIAPLWSIRFRWPDGARDCEAVAVDAQRGEIILIGKKRVPPDVFRLPLRPDSDAVRVAERLGTLAGVVQPSAADLGRNPRFGRYRSQISGADISADGRWLAVLNYRTAYVYPRSAAQSWAEATSAQPIEAPFPWLPQAEAIAFDAAGDLWIASERLPAPLITLPLAR